jgi:hypothetical protein
MAGWARHMHCVRLMRRVCVVVILLNLACGKQSDAEKLQKSVVSWKATLQIVAGARLRNEVRDGFALKTIEEAVEDLDSQSAKTSSKRAEHLIGLAAKLRDAIERDDTPAIAAVRDELTR